MAINTAQTKQGQTLVRTGGDRLTAAKQKAAAAKQQIVETDKAMKENQKQQNDAKARHKKELEELQKRQKDELDKLVKAYNDLKARNEKAKKDYAAAVKESQAAQGEIKKGTELLKA